MLDKLEVRPYLCVHFIDVAQAESLCEMISVSQLIQNFYLDAAFQEVAVGGCFENAGCHGNVRTMTFLHAVVAHEQVHLVTSRAGVEHFYVRAVLLLFKFVFVKPESYGVVFHCLQDS